MFLSRRYRPNKWPFFALVVLELGLTVPLLALTGIASPNLYRTKLWQDGADNGFNSSPSDGLYAAANYRPYKTPMVWSQFITNYNLVITVLSMFLLLIKATMYMLHVFPPVCSVALHIVLCGLYAVSVAFQGSADTTDPEHPQPGVAWYITKSCSVSHLQSNVGYCMQAKATFACFAAMLGLMFTYLCFAAWSCFPSKQQRIEYEERQRAKKERWAHLDDLDAKTPREASFNVPETPGPQTGLNPMTPRTLAFNVLGGTKNKKSHFSSPNPPKSPTFENALRSPGIPRSPFAAGFEEYQSQPGTSEAGARASGAPQMYFPPPPKQSEKK